VGMKWGVCCALDRQEFARNYWVPTGSSGPAPVNHQCLVRTRLVNELGEAFQFDWSYEYVVIAGLRRRLEVAHTKLAASRAFVLVAYFTQSHEMLFDAHTKAFEVFGGVPKRGIYDNMRTAVDKVGKAATHR
jgi:transposase